MVLRFIVTIIVAIVDRCVRILRLHLEMNRINSSGISPQTFCLVDLRNSTVRFTAN